MGSDSKRFACDLGADRMVSIRPEYWADWNEPTGPLYVLAVDHDATIRELAEVHAENDRLRAVLANYGGPCAYCSLPKEEWAKCREGFPGCPRADDAALCPHVGASLAADAAFEDREVAICQAVEFAEYVESHAKGRMAERAEDFMKVPFAEELRLRLRAAAAYKQAVRETVGGQNKVCCGGGIYSGFYEPPECCGDPIDDADRIETRVAQLLKAGP